MLIPTLAPGNVDYPWLQELPVTKRSSLVQGEVPLLSNDLLVRGLEAQPFLQFRASLKRCTCFWAFCQISCGLCYTCILLNSSFTQSCSPLILKRHYAWEHSPHIHLSACSWGTWSFLAFTLLEAIMEKMWPSVDPRAGPRNQGLLTPSLLPWNVHSTYYFHTRSSFSGTVLTE